MKIYHFLFCYVSRLKGKLICKTILNLMCGGSSILQALGYGADGRAGMGKGSWPKLLPELFVLVGITVLRGVLIRQTEAFMVKHLEFS